MDNIPSMKNNRSANFDNEEEQLLLSLVKQYKNFIECKRSNSKTWKEKENTWKTIEKEFNSNTGKCHRTLKNLKEKYLNLKKKSKYKWAEEKRMLNQTGGGSFKLGTESSADVVMRDILSDQIYFGMSCSYDSDRNLAIDKSVEVEEVHFLEDDSLSKVEDSTNTVSVEGDSETKSTVLVSETSSPNIVVEDHSETITEYVTNINAGAILKRPVAPKLTRCRRGRGATKNEVLIEEKLSFLRLQKEKFLEEHNLKMQNLNIKQKNLLLKQENLKSEQEYIKSKLSQFSYP